MADCIHSAIAPNMNRCIKCGAWLGYGQENTRAASGGDSASLEQRARDALSGLIHSMADIVNVTQTDAQFDADVLPRNPVMDAVAKMRQHWDELSKFITAALANRQGVGGWQLIETAPKDGREILLAVVSVYGWSLVIATWESYGWVDAEMRSVERNNYKAAQWMTLPEPPTQPAGDVGRGEP